MRPRILVAVAALMALSFAVGGNQTCVPVQPVERAAYFTGAGASYGECWGACRYDLTVDGSDLTLLVRTWEGDIRMDLSGDLAPRLTDAGAARAEELATALADVELQEVYGCPDCADGGACTVSLVRDGAASTHSYDCSMGPPDVLADADAFWQPIIRDLADCRENEWVTLPADVDCVPAWP